MDGAQQNKLLLTAFLSNKVKKYGYQMRYLLRTSGYGPAKVNLRPAAFSFLCLISHVASLFNIHLTKEEENEKNMQCGSYLWTDGLRRYPFTARFKSTLVDKISFEIYTHIKWRKHYFFYIRADL